MTTSFGVSNAWLYLYWRMEKFSERTNGNQNLLPLLAGTVREIDLPVRIRRLVSASRRLSKVSFRASADWWSPKWDNWGSWLSSVKRSAAAAAVHERSLEGWVLSEKEYRAQKLEKVKVPQSKSKASPTTLEAPQPVHDRCGWDGQRNGVRTFSPDLYCSILHCADNSQ